MKIHIVQKGDTLWKLAKKYGVDFEELKKMNSQLSNPDMIMPGMKLKIPSAGAAKSPSASPNTKINVGSKKEAIKPNVLKPIVKEAPKPSAVQPIVKEAPKPSVVQPIVKEAPKPIVAKPIVKEAPKPMAPVVKEKPMPVMPQPIISEIDINNYYTVNMAHMTVPKPQPKPIVKEAPKPIPQPKMPMVQEECVAVTPIMPGDGFCMPIYPICHQFCEPVPNQMIQPLCEKESSSLFESHAHMAKPYYGTYMAGSPEPMAMAPIYNYSPYQYTSPAPETPAHGMHHHIESSSSFTMESSSHIGVESSNYPGHYSPTMMQPMMTYHPQVGQESDCGCEESSSSSPVMSQAKTISQPMYKEASMNTPQMPQQPYQTKPMNAPQMPQQPYQTNPMNAPQMPQQPYQMNPMNAPQMPQQPYQMNPMNAAQMPQQPYQMNPMNAPQMPQQPYQMNPMNTSQPMYQINPMNAPQQLQPSQMNMRQVPGPENSSQPVLTPFGQQAMFGRDEEPLFADEQRQAAASEAFHMPKYADESGEFY